MTDDEKLEKLSQLEEWSWYYLKEHTRPEQWYSSRKEFLDIIERCQRIRAELIYTSGRTTSSPGSPR